MITGNKRRNNNNNNNVVNMPRPSSHDSRQQQQQQEDYQRRRQQQQRDSSSFFFSRSWWKNKRQQQRRQQQNSSSSSSSSLSSLLLSSPVVVVLVIIASLDNADKQLLASSYSILERLLRLDVEQLGYFSLATNLSYALSLPFWGWWIHRLTLTTTAEKTTTTTTDTTTATTNSSTNHIATGVNNPRSRRVLSPTESDHRKSSTHDDNATRSFRSSTNNALFKLLAVACGSWGLATIGIAVTTLHWSSLLSSSSSSLSSSSPPPYYSSRISWSVQIILRSLNGMALGSIIPLSQSLLVEVTPANLRGQAFGLLSVGEKLAGAVSSSAIVHYDNTDSSSTTTTTTTTTKWQWQDVYYSLGIASIVMGSIAFSIGGGGAGWKSNGGGGASADDLYSKSKSKSKSTRMNKKKYSDLEERESSTNDEMEHLVETGEAVVVAQRRRDFSSNEYNGNDEENRVCRYEESTQKQLPLRQIVTRIVRLPAFVCLVAQGVFGGTPWDMMSYLLLLMDWRGLTKDQIVTIQFTNGLSSMLGGWVGGVMGDVAASWCDHDGRLGRRPRNHKDNNDEDNDNTSSKGRIILAMVSVVGGIPIYGLFICSNSFEWALLWSNLFHFWATWTPSGAIRPIW